MDRKLIAYLSLLLVPWTVQILPEGVFVVFPWGLASSESTRVVSIVSFLFERTQGIASLPDWLVSWPVSSVVYAGALGNRTLDRVDLEDERLTAGLLLVAGLVHLQVTFGLLNQGQLSIPVGPVLLAGLAWWTLATPTDDGTRSNDP